MARPKLPNSLKKEKMNLTVSAECKEMADIIRIKKNISISEYLEECIRKDYRKLQKSGEIPEEQVEGQMNVKDLGV